VLRPLQLALKRLDELAGVAEILQEQADSINLEEDAYDLINKHIEEQQALIEKKAQEEAAKAKNQPEQSKDGSKSDYTPTPSVPEGVTEPTPKKIVSIDTASVMRDVNSAGIIETEQDIYNYLAALKGKLTALVNSNNKVRIK
jgi:hypothetical protein